MPIINKGIFNTDIVFIRQTGNDWPTAQVTSTADVIEASGNLYFTTARVNATVQPFLTTANVIETSGNLYFTTARVNATVRPFLTAANVANFNSTVNATIYPSLTTANVIESSSNLYFTTARVNATVQPFLTAANIANFSSTVNTVVRPSLTTANVIETSGNLYFTTARVNTTIQPFLTAANIANFASTVNATVQPFLTAANIANFASTVNATVQPFLTTANVIETAGNLYFTTDRVNATVQPFLTTANVIETAGNLYFTNTKVFNAITIGTITGDIAVTGNFVANGLIIQNVDVTNNILAGNINVGTSTSNIIVTDSITSNIWNRLYTANVIESASNLYFTNARVVSALIAGDNITIEANGRISANVGNITAVVQNLTTADVRETSNLYFTNTRARSAFLAGNNIEITPEGVISSLPQAALVSNDSEIIVATANTLTYALSRNITDPRSILVIDEGLIQIPTIDYTTAASSITFSTQPAVNSNIEIRYFGIDSVARFSSTFLATVNTFVGTGSNVTFPLTITPGGTAYTSVIINGVAQQTTAYSIVGSTIVFTEAPVANAVIDVRIYSGTVGSSFNTRTFVGNGVTNTYAITSGFNAQNILVFENGVAQVADVDYTVDANSVITFATAPAANIVVQIRELGSVGANLVNQIVGRDLRTGNIEPFVNEAQNIGSANLRYNKLFLSAANSIVMGNTIISISGTTLTLTANGTTTVVGASGAQGSTNARTLGYNLVFGG